MEEMVTVKIEEANQSDAMVIKAEEILQVMSGDVPDTPVMSSDIPDTPAMSGDIRDTTVTDTPPTQKTKSGYTNIERYNVLVRAYIDAHPHLPRQMQYAEAQQVWRSVRMDPQGAYMAVLRSLHGMALMAQANNTVAASDGAAVFETPREQHPLLLQAIDPTYTLPVPAPVIVPPPQASSPQFPQGPTQTSPQFVPTPSTSRKRIRIRKPRGRPPRPGKDGKIVQVVIRRKPGKRRGRPPKMKPTIDTTIPIIKRGPGRPRKHPLVARQTESPATVPLSNEPPIQPIFKTPEKQNLTDQKCPEPSLTADIQPARLKTPPSLIITPVASPPPEPTSNIPEPAEDSVSPTPAITISHVTNKSHHTVSSKHDVMAVEQWEPQAGLSFVQGNGLKMILSRVNNGLPLPEYRRRRHRKKSTSKNTAQQKEKESHPEKTTANCKEPFNHSNTSPPQGQAADSTVMDVDSQSPTSSQLCDYSPDQTFAAAILQYLLDLSELLGSSTSFVISQEIEQQCQNGPSNVSVYSGWLVGEQSIGPKLAATVRMSAKTNELDCLNQLVNCEDFREVVRTPYGRVKPVAILILEGRKPGDLVQFLEATINCFKEWDLDSIILASQPAVGQHVLCTLESNVSGSTVSSNGCHSSSDHHMKTKTMEVEQWKNRHLRSGQYFLQIAKCADKNCCLEWRTPLRKILPQQGFLPPPVPFAKGEQGPMAPRFEERDMASYGRLCERLVMESLVPRTAFQELPFDFYCPSARQSLSRQVCFDCGHYFCTQALRKLHSQLLHPSDDKH